MLRPGSWILSCSGFQGSRVGLIDHYSVHSPSWPVRSTAGAERGTCVSFGDIFSSFLWTRETDLVQASRSPLSSWLLLFVWLCWVFIPLCGLSLLWRATLHCSVWASLVVGRTLGHTGCSTQAQWLWLGGTVAPWPVGSSLTRNTICVHPLGHQGSSCLGFLPPCSFCISPSGFCFILQRGEHLFLFRCGPTLLTLDP